MSNAHSMKFAGVSVGKEMPAPGKNDARYWTAVSWMITWCSQRAWLYPQLSCRVRGRVLERAGAPPLALRVVAAGTCSPVLDMVAGIAKRL